MRLEAETTLTRTLMRRYLAYMTLRSQMGRLALLIAACFALIALSSALILMDPEEALGYVGLGFAVLLPAGFLTIPYWVAAIQFRSVSKDLLAQRFAFEDDSFEVVNDESDRVKGRSVVRYDGLMKAVDDKDLFYLFIGKNNAFVVEKRGFAEGEADRLARRLQEVLGARFVRAKKASVP